MLVPWTATAERRGPGNMTNMEKMRILFCSSLNKRRRKEMVTFFKNTKLNVRMKMITSSTSPLWLTRFKAYINEHFRNLNTVVC